MKRDCTCNKCGKAYNAPVESRHRLLCGDSGSAADLDKLVDGQVIDLVDMDPPYNVKVEPRSNNAIAAGLAARPATNAAEEAIKNDRGNAALTKALRSRKANNTNPQAPGYVADPGRDVHRNPGSSKATHRKLRAKDRPLTNDFVSDSDFVAMLHAWFGNAARVLKPGGSFYIWGGYANIGNYPGPLTEAGLYFSQLIVWYKQHPVLTRKDYMGDHEIAFYGWKEGAGHKYYGPANATDVWCVKKVTPQAMIHLTEKPVELAVLAVQHSSLPGEAVLDLFGGSGSTMIACEQTGRRAYLMELDPLYCDVIAERWKRFSGREAVRIAASTDGKAQKEIEDEQKE